METKTNPLIVPLAIVVAGGLIAGAIYFGGKYPANTQANAPQGQTASIQIAPITSADNIIGNSNAKIVIVTYSDYECPFCKTFHNTMVQIINTYKPDDVAWIYRQFPIAQLHPKALKESEAALCANDLGGNKSFWDFSNRIFEITPSNNQLDPSELPNIAKFIGLDTSSFNTCLSSGKFTNAVQSDVAAATKAGALGTPYSVIIMKKALTASQTNAINDLSISTRQGITIGGDNKVIVNGAQAINDVESAINALIK